MRGVAKKNLILLLVPVTLVTIIIIFQASVYLTDDPVLFNTVPKTRFEAWERVQQHRKRVLRAACERFPPDDPKSTRRVVDTLRMDEKHHLLYCPVPKIASSVWKLVLLVLTGIVDESVDPSEQRYSTALAKNLPELKYLEKDEASDRYFSYTKFMFTRHPFERVLSAYRNKMTKNTPDKLYFHQKYGRDIIRKFRKNPSERSLLKGDDVQFHEFVSYIGDTYATNGTYGLDPHWRPVADICRPCSVSYDVIGHFETMDLDADFILEMGNADMDFPKSNRSKRTQNLMSKYFKDVSEKDIQGLHDVFKKDFAIFNYEKTPSY